MPHDYERIGAFTLKEVLPYVPEKGTQKVVRKYAGKSISLSKKRLRVFAAKGTKCVCCGIEGSFLALERHKKGAKRWHFNLYAVDCDGTEVEMTLDHVIPKSMGGSSKMENLQPMCEPCNLEKGNTISNPKRKAYKCPSNLPMNLTKLHINLRPFVKRKKGWLESLSGPTLTHVQMMSLWASPDMQDFQKPSGGM